MSSEKCSNYEICEKYALYGICECDNKDSLSLPFFCEPHEKQLIKILSSIDEKLEKLLACTRDT